MSFYALFSRGDKDEIDPRLGYRDGMLCHLIRPDKWNSELILSDNMKEVYFIVEMDDIMWDYMREAYEPVGVVEDELIGKSKQDYIPDPDEYRKSQVALDYSQIEELTGIKGLLGQIRSYDPIEVIDGTDWSEDTFLDTTQKVYDKHIADERVVNSGSYTIGSSGQDYADVGAVVSDLGVAWTTPGLTFTLETDVTDTVVGAFPNLDSNGFTCKFTSDSAHNGNPTGGHEITWSDAWTLSITTGNDTGVLEWEKLRFKWDSNEGFCEYHKDDSGNVTLKIHDCMFDVNGNQLTEFIDSADTANKIEIWNVVVWDWTTGSTIINSRKNANTFRWENNTFYSSQNSAPGLNFNSKDGDVINNAVFLTGSTPGSCFSNTGSLDTNSNNASSDATATGQTNLTASTECESLTDTESDFLKCTSAGVLDTNGTTPVISGNDEGIRGNTRDGDISIGADEFAAGDVTITHTKVSVNATTQTHTVAIDAVVSHTKVSVNATTQTHSVLIDVVVSHTKTSVTATTQTHTILIDVAISHTKATVNATAQTHTLVIDQIISHTKTSVNTTTQTHTLAIDVIVSHTKTSVNATTQTHALAIDVIVSHTKTSANATTQTHTVLTDVSISHTKTAVNTTTQTHVAVVDVIISHTKTSVNATTQTHTVIIGVAFAHTKTSVNTTTQTHAVLIDVAISHTKTSVNATTQTHVAVVDVIVSHTKTSVNATTQTHTVVIGGVVVHTKTDVNATAQTHTVAIDAIVAHSKTSVTATTQTHAVLIDVSISHTKTSVTATTQTHTLAIDQLISHTKASVTATTQTHVVLIDVTVSHSTASVEATAQTHTVVIAGPIIVYHNALSYVILTQTHVVLTGVGEGSTPKNIGISTGIGFTF